MRRNWPKLIVSGVTAFTLLNVAPIVPGVPQPYAYASEAVVRTINQTVQLSPSAVLGLRDAHFLMHNQGKILAFTIYIHNKGASSIDLLDYGLRVVNRSGTSYKVNQVDKSKTSIAPGTSDYISYYAIVDPAVKLQDLTFRVVKWDFSVPGYERNLGAIQIPAAYTNKTAVFQPGIMLYGGTKLKGAIKSYVVTRDGANTNVTFQVLLENAGYQAVDLGKISFYMQSESNSVYKGTAQTSVTALPNERKFIAVNFSLPNTVSFKPLTLIVASADANSNADLPIGSFEAPLLTATKPTDAGAVRTIYLDGQTVETSVSEAFVYNNNDQKEISLQFTLKNTGTRAVDASSLAFVAETGSGIQYPLTFGATADKLLPGISKTIEVSGQIPESLLSDANARLILSFGGANQQESYMAGIYALNVQTSSGTSSSYQRNGYQVALIGIQRYPLESDDVLVAELQVKNTGSTAMRVPDLGGYFVADGVRLETATDMVELDSSISIAPGAAHHVAVYTRIPYTARIQTVSFVLTEKSGDNSEKTLYQFAGGPGRSVAKNTDEPYVISNPGRKADVRIVRAHLLRDGGGNRSFYGEFDLVNGEARTVNVVQLGGFLEDANGTLVPLVFTTVGERLTPNGKTLFAATGKLPNDFDANNYRLHLGQSIPIGGEQQERLLASTVAYKLSGEGETNTTLKNVQFAGFDLSFSEMNARLRIENDFLYKGIDLTFKYAMEQDSSYEALPKDLKLVFELEDQGSGKTAYSKEYRLSEQAEGTEEVFYPGTNMRQSVFFEDEKIMIKIPTFHKYKINLYVKIGNQKVLLASREFNWMKAETF